MKIQTLMLFVILFGCALTLISSVHYQYQHIVALHEINERKLQECEAFGKECELVAREVKSK